MTNPFHNLKLSYAEGHLSKAEFIKVSHKDHHSI